MNIGQASKASGVSVKMIRYYESIGLIDAPLRTESGYRVYSDSQVHALRFISQARDLGFSVEQMGDLLALWRDRSRASADVKTIALQHIEALQAKARALQAMSDTLMHLADHCHGDDRPDCPIIEGFAAAAAPAPKRRQPRFGVTGINPVRS
jgi:MerR family copper efflux transcriptional regulator